MLKILTTAAVLATLTVACSSQRAPAEMAVKATEDAMSTARPDIERYASQEMAGLTAGMDTMKAKLDNGDYAGVLTDASGLTSQIAEAAKTAAARKTELVSEWGSFASLPAMVAQVSTKVSELSAADRLPRGMNKETLESAKASLETAKDMWGDATEAQEQGDLPTAVAKAKEVKPMVEGLMDTLGVKMAM